MDGHEKLRVRRVAVERLEPRHIREMWDLYAGFYENADRARFRRDLEGKDCVFLGLGRESGRVRGFSTARFYAVRQGGRAVGVYFSGDTMVEPAYWGKHVLQRRVVPALLAWRLRHPFRRVYWHLTCNGYRTFLTMANSFPEYWPHPDRPLPAWERGLIDRISREQFGAAWCPGEGIVRDDARLKDRVAPFTSEVRAIPAVAFFLERNPGFAAGDELSMVGRVDTRFFLRVARKILRPGPPRGSSTRQRKEARCSARRFEPASGRPFGLPTGAFDRSS